MINTKLILTICCLTAELSLFAQTAPGRYAVILEDQPTAERFSSREGMRSSEAIDYRRQIEARQKIIRRELTAALIKLTLHT